MSEIFACFEAIRGEPSFDGLALLTYDEEFAKEWVRQYPYTIHPIHRCPSCGRWDSSAADGDEQNRKSSEGRWYTPWTIDVVAHPLSDGGGNPGKYSINNNQVHFHIMSQDKVLVKNKREVEVE